MVSLLDLTRASVRAATSLLGGRDRHRTAIGDIISSNELWCLDLMPNTSNIVICQLIIGRWRLPTIDCAFLILLTSVAGHAHEQLLPTCDGRVGRSRL